MSRSQPDPGPIWTRPEPRQRRPAHTREDIVQAALHIADAEGVEAVSMRRIARELRSGTMTLYHYVRTKDDLLALMGDAIMGEMLVPDGELPEGWREGLAAIARRTCRVFVSHPWVLDHIDAKEATAGPNTLRHVEQSLAAASHTGLPVEDQFELIGLVDDYVFGHTLRARGGDPFDERTGVEQRLDGLVSYIEQQLRTGEFPRIEAYVDGDPHGTFRRLARLAADEQRFERGLRMLLDGITLEVERRRAAQAF